MKTPATTSLIPLSVIPLVFCPKLENPSFFPSRLYLLAKPEPPPTDTGDQPDQHLLRPASNGSVPHPSFLYAAAANNNSL